MNEPSNEEVLPITPELFVEWRSPRLGNSNPTVLSNPVWEWLVRTRKNAWQATSLLGGPSALDAGPGWCFDRFGQSTTVLPDGREILIAGEHEDHYDPDFFIYNDVVVTVPDGAVVIYGYPREIFPPTDFHTATLLPGSIVLIGSLGYQEHRLYGETQVVQLMLDTFAIHNIEGRGMAPGWIHRHKATLSGDGQSITISGGMIDLGADKSLRQNIDDWVLHLADWSWTRNTDRRWQQWTFRRTDRKRSHLWNIRLAIWMRDTYWEEHLAKIIQQLVAETGRTPDLDLVRFLYRPDDSVTELPQLEDEHNVFRVLVDGIVVRFTEEGFVIRAMVEGRISDERVKALQISALEKLATLEGATWEIEAP